MNNRSTAIYIGILILLAGGFLFMAMRASHEGNTPVNEPLSPSLLPLDTSISDGAIIISYSSQEFGVATDSAKILASSTAPLCDAGFVYCLYYIGDAPHANGFEGAGLRIRMLPSLKTEKLCLNTAIQPQTSTSTGDYSAVRSGMIYRLFYRPNSSCHEFEPRMIGDDAGVSAELRRVLDTVTLQSGDTHLFAF